MIYHFVVQYFGGRKAATTEKELPAPPTQLDRSDAFGQTLSACHRSMSVEQQRIVRQVLPQVLRIGSCTKPPKDWRSFWRSVHIPSTDPSFRKVVRLWYSVAAAYAQQQADGSWQFVSPAYTNLSAVRGMCWLYEEVFG